MPAFDVRLRLHAADGTPGRILRTQSISATFSENAAGALSFQVSAVEAGTLSAPFVVGIQYTTNDQGWVSPRNNLFLVETDGVDSIDSNRVTTFSAVGYVPWLLARNLLQWSTTTKDGERKWSDSRPATQPVHTMMHEGRARGWAPFVTDDFNDNVDSNGLAWQDAHKTEQILPLLTTAWSVLESMSAQGHFEWWTEGVMLRCFRSSTGSDRTASTHIGGKGYMSQPVSSSFEDAFTHLTITGDKLKRPFTIANSGTTTEFGRLEVAMTQSGIEKQAVATKNAQPVLVDGRGLKREYTFEWEPKPGTHMPFASLNIGDMVTGRVRGGNLPLRVIGIQVQHAGGKVTARVIAGSKIKTLNQRIVKRAGSVSVGKVIGGSGSAVPPVRTAPNDEPAVPTGLNVAGNWPYFREDNTAVARIILSWGEVTTTIDGAEADVTAYEVYYRTPTASGWRSTRTAEPTLEVNTWESGVAREVKVRAISRTGELSAFTSAISVTPATPVTPPAKPSAPSLTTELATITAGWDGQLGGGTPLPGFKEVITEVLDGTTWKRAGQPITAAGQKSVITGLSVGASVQVRFVAYSILGNASEPSDTNTIVVEGVQLPDVGGTIRDAIDEALGTGEAAQTTANTAVTNAAAAQTAADDAADAALAASGLASQKGKVITQSAAPAVADRLAQNLWIDTTSNNNTPKRWNGTAWVAVTDKVATDAAAAAAAAATAASTAQTAAGNAQTTANTAVTSASNRNALYHSTTAPSGTGTRIGDLWHQWSALTVDGRLMGVWVWNGTAWQKRGLDESYIPLLDIGSGTYGSLSGDRLTARSIVAEKILVADFTNLFQSAYFITGGAPIGLGVAYTGSEVSPTGGRLIQIAARDHYASVAQRVEANPGDEYYVEVVAKRIAGTANLNPRVGAFTASGGVPTGMAGSWGIQVTQATETKADLGNGWVRLAASVKIPDSATDVANAGMYLQIDQTSPFTTTWIVTDIRMYRRSNANLIVDGSVTARKVNTTSIWADTAWISAAVVSVLTAGRVQSHMVEVGFRAAQGQSTNRVPAPVTDSVYWNRVKNGSIILLPELATWSWTQVGLSANGMLHASSSTTIFHPVTALTPVPTSRKLFVVAPEIGSGRTQVSVREYTDTAGATLLNATRLYASGEFELDSTSKSYQVNLVTDGANTPVLITRLEVFEVIGTGGSAQRVEISPSGLRFFDADGTQRISLGTSNDDVLDIAKKNSLGETVSVASINEDGEGVFQGLEVSEDASFMGSLLVGSFGSDPSNGMDLSDIPMFDRMGRGIIAACLVGNDGMSDVTAVRQTLAAGTVELLPGRIYQWSYEGVTTAWWTSGSGTGDMNMSIFTGTGAQSVNAQNSTNGAASSTRILSGSYPNGSADGQNYQNIRFEPFSVTQPGLYNVILLLSNYASPRGYSFYPGDWANNRPRLLLTDLGPVAAWAWENWRYRVNTGDVSPPAPPVSTSPTTKVWNATWSQLWGPSGSVRPSGSSIYDDGRMLQGGGSSVGANRAAQVGFPALGISGKTIKGAWLRLKVRHTSVSKATLRIGTHGNASAPGGSSPNASNVFTKSVAKGNDLWIPIPSARWAALAAGTIRGFQIGGPNVNTGSSDYVILDGYSTTNAATSSGVRPQLKVTYQ